MRLFMAVLFAVFFTLAPPAGADDNKPVFDFPLDCEMGKNCWISRYMDRGQGHTAADYMCGSSTQDQHKGTDIAIADLGKMAKGVTVLAAREGVVWRIRDNMKDVSSKSADPASIKNRECGNAVIIQHGEGWHTQYCHLKQNSLKVKEGETVNTGQMIGEIGLSGQTEYPHLHFAVQHNGLVVDPFDGGAFGRGCQNGQRQLWTKPIDYASFTLLPVQVSTHARSMENIWHAGKNKLNATSPAIIITARAFHSRAGDRWRFLIIGPDGASFFDETVTRKKDRQFAFQYMGRKAPPGGFKSGQWKASVEITREADGKQYFQETSFHILP